MRLVSVLLDLYILSRAQASNGHLTYFNNEKVQKKIKYKSIKAMRKKHMETYKNSYFRIMLYVICKIYFFKFIHEIILVFLFKEKGETSMSYRNKNVK